MSELPERYRVLSSESFPWCNVKGPQITAEQLEAHLRNVMCGLARRIAELRGCELKSVEVNLVEKSR